MLRFHAPQKCQSNKSHAVLHVRKRQSNSLYRLGQALRILEGCDSQISRQLANGGKVVSLTIWPPLPPEKIPGIHFCYRLSQTQGYGAAEGLCQWKIPMTPSRPGRYIPWYPEYRTLGEPHGRSGRVRKFSPK